MQSASQLESNAEPPHSPFAQFLGIFIALITLVLPLCAVAYFSSTAVDILDPVPYPAVQLTE